MPTRKKSETVQLKVRMKEPLRAQIEKSATERGVSMNNEMVDRLERSFSREADAASWESTITDLFGSTEKVVIGSRFISLLDLFDSMAPGWRDDAAKTEAVAIAAAHFVRRLGASRNEPVKKELTPITRGLLQGMKVPQKDILDELAKAILENDDSSKKE